MLKSGDSFGDVNTFGSYVISLEETLTYYSSVLSYLKIFSLILSRSTFVVESLSKILPQIDKVDI